MIIYYVCAMILTAVISYVIAETIDNTFQRISVLENKINRKAKKKRK